MADVRGLWTSDVSGNEAQRQQMEQATRPQLLLHKLLQDKAKEWTGLTESKPLRLLDLPLDVLQCIVSNVSHTNDLTSLALVHSSLHSLVIPHIYSRFDIVWPEANPTVESRVGVDALTYGLATLVMAHDVFGEAPYQQQTCSSCQHCRDQKPSKPSLQSRQIPTRVRRGNYFAQHTRKFSLGNGPVDWVTEYLITKEGGKMLGTLVALALGRMRNLEAFVWDMPTGVLRDVWLALASLGNRADGHECRLEKVWVRWHDNRDAAPTTGTAIHHTNLPSLLHGTASSLFHIPPYPSVEFPTFSILPPLKSISVLDIDEVPYAEELSLLLERSLDKLQELRVGVALHAQRDLPFRPLEDRSVVPPLPFAGGEERARPGGILGILVSRFCSAFSSRRTFHGTPYTQAPLSPLAHLQAGEVRHGSVAKEGDVTQLGELLSAQTLHDEVSEPPYESHAPNVGNLISTPRRDFGPVLMGNDTGYGDQQNRKLKLTTLEFERVYLSIPVLSRAIDWSRLESLTLLGCMNHEQLWKALRRTFTPAPLRTKTPPSKTLPTRTRSSVHSNLVEGLEYKLNIRRLHTDTVSRPLLAFIKDTLAPDTLEWLFLQETNAYKSHVTIDEIYRSAIRRHRHSLRKLLIDSEIRDRPALREREREREREGTDTSWRRWMCSQDLITCITSGKMQLRELSISLDYKDWHYFLQRLPSASGLRSLHIPHIADHPYGRPFDPRDVAWQVLNIIALRRDIELCYLGLEKKCFEILEYKTGHVRPGNSSPVSAQGFGPDPHAIGVTTYTMVEDEEDEDPEDGGAAHHTNQGTTADGSEDEGDDDEWEMGSNESSNIDETDDDEHESEEDGWEFESTGRRKPTFRLREILFYDDKISIFKARHGKL